MKQKVLLSNQKWIAEEVNWSILHCKDCWKCLKGQRKTTGYEFLKETTKRRRIQKYKLLNVLLYNWHGAIVYPDRPTLEKEAMEIKRRSSWLNYPAEDWKARKNA